MDSSKKQVKGTKTNPVIDLETIFLRLLLIGQQRQLELAPLFSYELCAVPPALIDEYSCLRKGNKSGLVKRLGVLEITPDNPDMVIVDVSQLFYRIVWPFGGKPSDLVDSIKERLNHYPNESKKVIVFDKYENVSAKDHERKRRANEVVTNYELSISSKLPKRDAIMKNKINKRQLGSVLCTFDFGDGVTTDSSDDYVFGHDEADITMVSYVLDAANKGHKVVRVLSNDTDVFVLLVYWVHLSQLTCKVQMERWDGTIFDIGATCKSLGSKCLQLLGMHALSGCDTTSFPFGKGKITALKTMLNGTFPGLQEVLGETKSTNEGVEAAATTYVLALYGQSRAQSLESARFNLFRLKKRNPKVSALPPTSANLKQHAMRAHLQVMLWKAANRQGPPIEAMDITNFGWTFEDGFPVPVIDQGIPAPPELTEVIRCQCKAQDKKCGKETCSCHKDKLSCTSYCNCAGGGECFNPHTTCQVRIDEENEVQALTTREMNENEEEEEVPDAFNVDEWV
ncbi:hypothetical protein FSP39_015885 [Pinctada imbricata]|uniref:Tesmin/TSO1-like CXC domain-containing protein n=1 Tax=Pinctada imbricata TaxID=66713 RepID=A0AA89C3P4_PINIB|nr:hypothetical protein FSP39_015885 [Pinctada imbricata]